MNCCYIIRDNGACGYYRCELPFKTVGRNTDITVTRIEKGDKQDHIEQCLTDADVVVIARPSEPEILKTIQTLKECGKKVVVDFDDDLWHVSPLSPHYEEWGVENVQMEVNGKVIPVWQHGQNFDAAANRERLEGVKKCCEAADSIIVTTDELAKAYNQFGRVDVLPNCVDTGLWQKLPLVKEDKQEIRLYWSGGASHFEDWTLLQDAVPIIMEKYPQTRLVLMGTKFDGTLKKIDPSRIEHHPWVPTPAYPYKTAILNADISLIPLRDTVFNRGKSAIKWIEQGALSVPSVTSLVTPYKEMYDGRNGVFVDNGMDAWVEGISYLIDNPMLRWKMGADAHATVKAKFDINTQYGQWETLIRELADGN